MKRCIIVGTRKNTDEKTGDELLFVTLCRLPSKSSKGGLWYPKKDQLLCTACVNKTKKPEQYEKFSKILPGTLVDITMGVSDFDGKQFIASIDVVPETMNLYDEAILYT